MNALVYLENDVNAFSISDTQFDVLKRNCPGIDFKIVKSIEQIPSCLPGVDFFITWKFDLSWYAIARQLKAIFTPAAGNDWIGRDERYPVPVYNGTFHGTIMAETVLGMIIYFNRHFSQLITNRKNKVYDRNVLSSTSTLGNQQVIIIGYGAIGKTIARVLKNFHCKIIGVKRTIITENDSVVDQIITFDQLFSYIGYADHVITILPNNHSTDHILTSAHFQAMKRSAIFYNVGRGNCYAESDIIEALEKGYIAGAGLDVFETEPLPENSKLWNLPQVFIMPHASAICKEYLDLYITELTPKLNNFTK